MFAGIKALKKTNNQNNQKKRGKPAKKLMRRKTYAHFKTCVRTYSLRSIIVKIKCSLWIGDKQRKGRHKYV